MAKELTVENLAEVVAKQGIKAAQDAVADATANLNKVRAEKAKKVEDLEKELEAIDAQLGQVQTILIGAVKKAASMSGLSLDIPAGGGKKPGQKRERMTNEALEALRASIKAAIGKGGKTRGEIIAANPSVKPTTINNVLVKLMESKAIKREGDSPQTYKYVSA